MAIVRGENVNVMPVSELVKKDTLDNNSLLIEGVFDDSFNEFLSLKICATKIDSTLWRSLLSYKS